MTTAATELAPAPPLRPLEIALLAALGLPLSYLGSHHVLLVGGRFVPELVLLPVLGVLFLVSPGALAFAKRLLATWLLPVLLVTTIIAGLGLFHPNNDLVSFYAGFRALALAILALAIGLLAHDKPAYATALLVVTLSTVLMALAHQILLAADTGLAKNPFPVLAAVIGVVLSLRTGRPALGLVFLVVLGVAAGLSLFRQNVIIAGITVAATAPILLLSGATLKRLALFAAIGLLSGLLLAQGIEAYLAYANASGSRAIQGIDKWQDLNLLLERGVLVGSERARLESYRYIAENLGHYLLPNGLVNDAATSLRSFWGGPAFLSSTISPTRDSVVIYLIVLCGAFATILMLALLASGAVLALRHTPLPEDKIGLALLALVLATLFVLDGTLLTQLEKAAFTGTALALVLTPVRAR